MTQSGRRVDKTAAGFGVIKTGAKKTTKLAVRATLGSREVAASVIDGSQTNLRTA